MFDTLSLSHRQAYLDYFAGNHRRVRDIMQQCAVPLHQLATTDSDLQALHRVLANPGVESSLVVEAVA